MTERSGRSGSPGSGGGRPRSAGAGAGARDEDETQVLPVTTGDGASGGAAAGPAAASAGASRAGSPAGSGRSKGGADRSGDDTALQPRPGPVQPEPARSGPPGPAADAEGARTAGQRATPARPAARPPGPAPARSGARRRARLALQRIDPWSVFLFSFVAAIFLGVVLVVAVGALYALLNSLGVLASVNELIGEVTRDTGPDAAEPEPLLTAGRILGAAGVLAAIYVVLLTVLATLGALLYNLCAAMTGGVEVQLGERD